MKNKKIILVLFAVLLITAILTGCSDKETENITVNSSTFPLSDTESYYGDAFGDGEVIDINVDISDEDWEDILANPIDEEFHTANVTFNGITVNNVAFRTKGNSTLSSVAKDTESDRYSFKIKTDKYVDDQTISGLNEFVLNNNYNDPSYLREYLTYEAMESLGVIVPNVAYCNLYINDELFGFYLCVESYDDSFVERITDDEDACLYKADDDCTLVSSASGFDCQYGDDDDFVNIKNLITVLNKTTEDNKAELEKILDVESVLKATAVNYVLGNYDSYSGKIAHNYYLLYADGKFEYIGWDYNMSFGGFPEDSGKSASSEVSSPLYLTTDENRPLISKLLAIDEYYDIYVGYVEQLAELYSDFESYIEPKVEYIKSYVENDPSAFYTVEEFEQSVTLSNETNTQTQMPTDGQELPEGQVPPTDGEELPEGQVPPTDGEELPEGQVPPADGEELPEGQVPPQGGNVRPGRQPGQAQQGLQGNNMSGSNTISIVNYIQTKLESIENSSK